MSDLNNLLGFKRKTRSNTNALSGAASNEPTKRLRVPDIQKGVSKMVSGISPQARVIGTFVTTIIIGAPIYSFIEDPRVQIGFMAILSVAVLFLVWGLMDTKQLKWVMISAWLTGTSIWMYIFIKRLEIEREEDDVGKTSYVCSPVTRCKNDGWYGPYNGTSEYIYQDPHTNKKTKFIPGRNFKATIPNKFTYSFWLRVVYKEWIKPEYRGTASPVLIKGGSTRTGVPAVMIDPNTNIIQFQVTPLMAREVEVLSVNYPFDTWVQYTLVIYKDSAELYVNGLLRKTKILKNSITMSKAPLYLGVIPEDVGSGKGYLPGELLYLTYYNKSLSAEEVDNDYKEQKLEMMKLESPYPIGETTDEDVKKCKKCPKNCKAKEDKKTNSLLGFLDDSDKKTLDTKTKTSKKAHTIDTTKYSLSSLLSPDISKYLGIKDSSDTSNTSKSSDPSDSSDTKKSSDSSDAKKSSDKSDTKKSSDAKKSSDESDTKKSLDYLESLEFFSQNSPNDLSSDYLTKTSVPNGTELQLSSYDS